MAFNLKEILPFTTLSRRRRARFYMMLGQTLDAGIPLLRAMDVFLKQVAYSKEKHIAQAMRTHIEDGGDIVSSMQLFPQDFPDSEIKMIAAAEHTGAVPQVLSRISSFLDGFSNELRAMYTGFIYPAMLLFVVFVFIPLFKSIFLGGTEDVLLQILRNAITLAILIFAAVIVWRMLKQLPGFAYFFDAVLLRLPVIGSTILQISRARFARMFECMYSSGVTVIESVQQSAHACGNKVITKKLLKAVPALREGEPLTAALWRTQILPSVCMGMFEVAEQTGNMEQPLQKYAEHEEQAAALKIQIMARFAPMLVYFIIVILLVVFFIFPVFMQYINMFKMIDS